MSGMRLNATPKVSVIIAGYEAELFIGRAVASALAQTLTDIEVIVIDDASEDRTLRAAERAGAHDFRLATMRLPRNGGPSAARNAGLAAARGEWVAVLDADDAMEPERLEKLVAFAEDNQADIVADAMIIVAEGEEDGPGKVFPVKGLPSPLSLADYARDNRMHCQSGGSGYLKPMFRRAFLTKHALAYDFSLRIAEDWTFVADALACGARFMLLDEPLYRYTRRPGSISHRLSVEALEKMLLSADAFSARHSLRANGEARRALAERRKSLANALAFQRFVERFKEGRRASALAGFMARPGGWHLLRMPIQARLRGSRALR